MLIAIGAGHYLGTPGKRCLKSIDPNETREWVLNDRVADHVEALLAGYDCQVLRVDDTTGQKGISLKDRVAAANKAKADVAIAIHHNAGIKGGLGGGIVIYRAPGSGAQTEKLQAAVYHHTVAATGLRGNRANPLAQAYLYALTGTKMPAVLCELGFMDSRNDTPIILTPEYSRKAAEGIVAALVEVYGLKPKKEENEMTKEEIKKLVADTVAEAIEKYKSEQAAALPVPDNTPAAWEKDGVDWAVERGLVQGDDTGNLMLHSPITRAQMCVLLKRDHDADEDGRE